MCIAILYVVRKLIKFKQPTSNMTTIKILFDIWRQNTSFRRYDKWCAQQPWDPDPYSSDSDSDCENNNT